MATGNVDFIEGEEQKMNITYEKCGDYLIPNLIPDPEGELKKHLLMIQEQAEERFDLLVEHMAEREEVTEQLKAQDQLLWVQRMNSIRARVEDIVREEIIYCL